MSKQSIAKEKQGYTPYAQKVCASCVFFTKETVPSGWQKFTVDKNLRCVKGGFKVGKMSTCDEWTHANPPNVES